MKKSKLLAVVLAVVLMFTGCMMERIPMKVTSDGHISMTVSVYFKKDTCDKILAKIREKGDEFSIAIAEGFKKDMKYTVIGGTEFYEITESKKYTYKEFMKEFNNEKEGTSAYVTKETLYLCGADPASQVSDYSTKDMMDNKEMESYMKAYGIDESVLEEMKDITVIYSVEFDKDIVKTNGEVSKGNPKQVFYTLTGDQLNKKTVIFATTNTKDTEASIKATIKASNTIATSKVKKLKVNKSKKKAKKTSVTVKIKKVTGAKKYKIQYATNSKFKKAKSKTIKKTSCKIKNLKKGKKYYFRVYAIKQNFIGKEVVSKASKKKSVKIKK